MRCIDDRHNIEILGNSYHVFPRESESRKRSDTVYNSDYLPIRMLFLSKKKKKKKKKRDVRKELLPRIEILY